MNPINSLWGNIFKERNEACLDTCLLLKKLPLFSGLRRGELREIDRLVHRRRFKEGEVIFWEGEPGVGMYIVQEGEVGIYRDFSKCGQKELARLRPGDFFGEMALLEDDCRSATAVAGGETQLVSLIHADLFDLINRKPQLGVKLLSTLANMLARRLRMTNLDLQRLTMDTLTVETGGRTEP
ncbi:MAG: cyclic nucleotide-binding domain-containing protein [Acidobacteria bacterium]|jgi:CRP-like cAMP-binding protein|nr:cyclic nucleotide-binding domain-containing protein [Acidobacteriota bacterium]